MTRPTLAQQSAVLSGVKINWPVSVFFAEKVMPFPSGPGSLARNRMRVKEPAANASTLGS